MRALVSVQLRREPAVWELFAVVVKGGPELGGNSEFDVHSEFGVHSELPSSSGHPREERATMEERLELPEEAHVSLRSYKWKVCLVARELWRRFFPLVKGGEGGSNVYVELKEDLNSERDVFNYQDVNQHEYHGGRKKGGPARVRLCDRLVLKVGATALGLTLVGFVIKDVWTPSESSPPRLVYYNTNHCTQFGNRTGNFTFTQQVMEDVCHGGSGGLVCARQNKTGKYVGCHVFENRHAMLRLWDNLLKQSDTIGCDKPTATSLH
ncbi:hypothetical protein GNI_175780 [Gregarina niphandrodes]|uniref:Uncharacterized protein n=1 Tax=Gregarina niphandrodes TaxID=110365 RepID=A0A023AXA3_GRENI|nr:hypothetical protein GNI_175780 [Gregarina niphandrodes]EZG43361.1 hypothetical protein GNI_175780 [Gregarina niphandrodes]|eukprot:XP_011134662.1 hypothetical protein GNI_175780 [Gregarina niphandrodes]